MSPIAGTAIGVIVPALGIRVLELFDLKRVLTVLQEMFEP